MNTKILEEMGKFIDKNYLNNYTIEGYFGFAYLKLTTIEGDNITWEYYLNSDGEVKCGIKE